MSIKTILVPAGGSESDHGIFETALVAAAPFAAHLDFYHVIVEAGEAAANIPHAGFAMGAGLVNALAELRTEERTRWRAARDHVESFCHHNGIALREKLQDRSQVSASWSEESGNSTSLIIHRARCSDLIIMGRKTHNNHLPDNLVERLLLESGRPILLVPSHAAHSLYGTIMVCWKNCREAAHAVTAAMPLLRQAARVFIVSVSENDDDEETAAVDGVARQMRWHGIHAVPERLRFDGRPIARILSSAARDYKADLMVMGGYSRNPLAEFIFGGCTDTFLRAADRPILLVH
jgi:nucleotide-binding universal stress UspA family protein